MADKITIDQVNELLGFLRTDASVDAKVQLVTAAKSGIKQHNVPDNAIPILFEALRTASFSQHAALVNAGFTGLNHLLTRLSRQEPKFLIKETARTLPLIIEKFGDQKEKYRAIALQALTTLYNAAPMDVERSIRNTAMTGKNPRAKEMSMQWLLQMHHEQGLQFRAYVPVLMELLEDADGMVRDAAKATVIELFRDAPATAKTDLKKQLKNFKVRPAIEQAIVKELAPAGASAATTTTTSVPLAPADPIPRPESRAIRKKPSTNFAASMSSVAAERPTTPLPDRPDQVEPTYVSTQRELDDTYKEMHIWFEGKETEQNWLKREESVTKLRRLIAGNATDYADAFLGGFRGLLDGIMKAVISLRTSLCKEGCSLIQDLANAFGSGIDPMVEILLQNLIKLSAGTKKISSQLANSCVEAIIGKATYGSRILQHVWSACQDKNVQPRTYASSWLKIILTRESGHKERVEHSGGLDVVEKCIKKGLNDANPGVRERMRATYWYFATLWPARAEFIMTNLDGTAQKLLQNDPHNPNSPKRAETSAPAARPGLGFSKSTNGPPKPSLRETMLAKKKEAMAATTTAPPTTSSSSSNPTRNLPARPGSAMAHFSPVRTVSGSSSNTSSSATAAGSTFGRQRAEGGLSVAPVRPAKRRPELHARPATAGPYSVRTHDHPSAEQSSPPEPLRIKSSITPKTLGASPKRTVPRPRPGHQATASDSNLVTPSRPVVATKKAATNASNAPNAAPSTRESPPKSRPGVRAGGPVMPTRPASARAPSTSPSRARAVPGSSRSAHAPERSVTPTSPTPIKVVADVLREIEPVPVSLPVSGDLDDDDDVLSEAVTSPPLKVYEDPFSDDQSTPKPSASIFSPSVLEDKPVNEDAGNLARMPDEDAEEAAAAMASAAEISTTTVMDAARLDPVAVAAGVFPTSPEKAKQNTRLLDSGIAKVKAQALDVHGFRKLQGIIRDASNAAISNGLTTKTGAAALFTDERFDALLLGLFAYLESPVTNVPPEKVQDVKAQILATIKLLLKKSRDFFQPHVSRGLEALLATRAGYDARTHMVAGLELLADELVTLGDAAEIALVLTRALNSPASPPSPSASAAKSITSPHSLSMGLHVLKVLVDSRPAFHPTDTELAGLAGLAQQCLDSSESGVRMDAVQLCVAIHERVGDGRFWEALRGVKDDPKSLITYYIVKRQREQTDQPVRA
ncbi:heat repeat containing protein [Ophiostoma piceae UAMH 11346]|uniref:Heat repeat containing protein n=1 Tax=Ophiostoma piceae (strain UAMH 11346) TaxID=1262450 RepID=S3CYU3_OPHP1|nr:heat repeat containing protein [Ophiostoma piceae UAMH 11346]